MEANETALDMTETMVKAVMPTRSIGLLMAIGFIDLVVTAWLYVHGLIQELNPIMRAALEHSPILFILLKGGSLVLAWVVLARYCKTDKAFVKRACLSGSLIYVTLWASWFFAAR
jgi:hypothetical protein